MREIRDEAGTIAQIDEQCGGTVRSVRHAGAGTIRELLYDPEGPGAGTAGAADQRGAPGAPGCTTALFAGRLLVPFADRIPQGRYRWHGRDYQLPCNDTENGDAIHGFLYRRAMTVTAQSDSRLSLRGSVGGQAGYPWRLEVVVNYAVGADRFSMEVVVTGRGVEESAAAADFGPAPMTLGWHPYFANPDGGERIDTAVLRLDADRYLETDEHLRLTGRRPSVDGTPLDFRSGRPIGARELDVAVERGPDGTTETIAVPGPSGGRVSPVVLTGGRRRVTVETAGLFRRLQLFVPPGRGGIAIEPVSAPASAFNDGSLGVSSLAVGESARAAVTVSWSL